MTKKVLLTGASGFLGWNFCKQFSDKYIIVGTYFRNCPEDIDIEWVKINLLETKKISTLIKQTKPDIVVHLAAISNTTFCEQHPALSHHINVYSTIAVAEACAEVDIPMIFASTDLVFNGNSAPYQEDDFCYPISQYGIQKQMAEEVLLSDYKQVFVARLPLMFGFGPTYCKNFFTTSLHNFIEKTPINAFIDEYRTMISTDVAGVWIDKLIEYCLNETIQPKEQLFHLGGSESCSRYDFFLKIAALFNFDAQLIIPTSQKDLDLNPARPPDVSLDSDLASRNLFYKAPTIDAQLLELKKQYKSIKS